MSKRTLSRRQLLQAGGVLLVGFSLADLARPAPASAAADAAPGATGSVPAAPLPGPADQVDSWVAIAQAGDVTIYSGKVELGTGTQTALAQIAAEELDVPFDRITMVMGDTGLTPDEGYTAGSKTLQTGGVALRQACAEARAALVELAADRLGVPVDQLVTRDGAVAVGSDAARQVGYGELIGGRRLQRTVSPNVQTKPPSSYQIVGQPVPRVELAGKLTGAPSYVQDHTLPGMLHGRVVRPAGIGATLQSVDEASVADVPGLVKVVRSGNFLGVVAEREEQAIQAARKLQATWAAGPELPEQSALFDYLRQQPTEDKVIQSAGDVEAGLASAAQQLVARYERPYVAHASIGPSCALADVRPDGATVWSSTQGVYPLRGALAQLLGLAPDQVQVIHLEGAGAYGHNGFDDVAGDAALLSRAVGRPVRVQWMRADEFAWEPKGPAMVMEARGGLDAAGNVVAFDFGVWTPTHSTRPGAQAGNLLAGQLMDPPAPPARNGFGGGDRNAKHIYTFPNNRVTAHWLTASPLRPSAFRGLGASANVFANESFVDELAALAGADPVEFRLRHLDDARAIAVLRGAADRAGWPSRPAPAPRGGSADTPLTGRGVAFAQYETENAYAAVVAEVEVDPGSGVIRVRRAVVGHDCGLIVNPDGLRNQIEGNVLMATSWTLKEQIRFDRSKVTSVDWRGYPILTFPEIPDVEIVLFDRPDQPALGAGEPASVPVAAAIANAVFDATGARLRSLPLTPERVKAALAQRS